MKQTQDNRNKLKNLAPSKALHSKTIRKSFAVDPALENSLRQKVAPNTENYQTVADAHLIEALMRIPFEVEGIEELKGNAMPPPFNRIHGSFISRLERGRKHNHSEVSMCSLDAIIFSASCRCSRVSEFNFEVFCSEPRRKSV